MKPLIFVFAASVAIQLSAEAQSSVLAYSTLANSAALHDANGTLSVQTGHIPGPSYQSIADTFIPSVSGNLASVEFGIKSSSGANNFDFTVAPNGPDNLPLLSDILASGAFASVALAANPDAITTVDYGGPALALNAGTTYWLIATPADSNSSGQWRVSDFPTVPSSYFSLDNGKTYSKATFQGSPINETVFGINVIPTASVPEPKTNLFFAMAAASLVLFRRFFHPRSWLAR